MCEAGEFAHPFDPPLISRDDAEFARGAILELRVQGRTAVVAAVVAFLASERASCVNGTSIAVDGGMIRSLF